MCWCTPVLSWFRMVWIVKLTHSNFSGSLFWSSHIYTIRPYRPHTGIAPLIDAATLLSLLYSRLIHFSFLLYLAPTRAGEGRITTQTKTTITTIKHNHSTPRSTPRSIAATIPNSLSLRASQCVILLTSTPRMVTVTSAPS